jgi:hypothetical protein
MALAPAEAETIRRLLTFNGVIIWNYLLDVIPDR